MLEVKGNAGVKPGNGAPGQSGCRCCHREHTGDGLSMGGHADEPMEGKGFWDGAHVLHGFTPEQPGFCLAKLFLSP